jgi:hypothetical protein
MTKSVTEAFIASISSGAATFFFTHNLPGSFCVAFAVLTGLLAIIDS